MPDIAQMRQEYFGTWGEEADSLKDENTCCSQTMAVWLIICNAILLILAIACFGVGIWISSQPAFQFTAGSLGVGCIFLGIFLLMVGALGLCAACKKSKCGLGIYSTLLTIFVVAEIAAMAVAIAAPGIAVAGMNATWGTMSAQQKNAIGLFYGCCEIDANDEAVLSLAGDNRALCTADGQKTGWDGNCEVHGLVWEAESRDGGQLYSFAKYSSNIVPGTLPAQSYEAYCTQPANLAASGQWTLSAELQANCFCAKAGTVVNNNPVEKDCRSTKGAIPKCNQAAGANPFKFAAGVANDEIAALSLNAGAAACYAKFENFLAANMGGSIAVLVILFLYQLFNVGFACKLWCAACGKSKGDDAEEDKTAKEAVTDI